jgi:hypothetical protein
MIQVLSCASETECVIIQNITALSSSNTISASFRSLGGNKYYIVIYENKIAVLKQQLYIHKEETQDKGTM